MMRVDKGWPVRYGLLMLLALAAVQAGAEEYFLDGAQRKELLMEGYITGRDGARYNVWIVPGYSPSMEHVGKGWHAAGDDLKEYARPDFVPDMLDLTRGVMRFARHDIIRDFALQGTSKAWRESADVAQRRTRRRVFGWWLAWPWAVVEGTAETVVRVGLGVPAGVGIWAGGGVVTPVSYALWPMAMSVGHGVGEGVVLPLGGVAWNTLVAPPLALAGQQPAPERADGWWMKRMADPAEADVRARLAAWQQGWYDDADLVKRREALAVAEAEHRKRLEALEAELAAERKAWNGQGAEERRDYEAVAQARALEALSGLRADMQSGGYSESRLQAMREALAGELQARGMSPESARQLLDAWLGPTDAPPPRWQQTPKTDPLQQVIQRMPANPGPSP